MSNIWRDDNISAITLKARDNTFRTVTRARTLDEPADLASELHRAATALYRERVDFGGRGVRLLGLGAKDLVPAAEIPPVLFPDERKERERRVARAADELRTRFGKNAARPARLLDPRRTKDDA